MKAGNFISQLEKTFVLVFAIIILLTSISSHYLVELSDEEPTTHLVMDNEEDNGNGETILYQANMEAIINFVNIDIHFESFLIREVKQVTKIVFFTDCFQTETQNTFYITLFRRIISPNAP